MRSKLACILYVLTVEFRYPWYVIFEMGHPLVKKVVCNSWEKGGTKVEFQFKFSVSDLTMISNLHMHLTILLFIWNLWIIISAQELLETIVYLEKLYLCIPSVRLERYLTKLPLLKIGANVINILDFEFQYICPCGDIVENAVLQYNGI